MWGERFVPSCKLTLKAPSGVGWAAGGELIDGQAEGLGVFGVGVALAAIVSDGKQIGAEGFKRCEIVELCIANC